MRKERKPTDTSLDDLILAVRNDLLLAQEGLNKKNAEAEAVVARRKKCDFIIEGHNAGYSETLTVPEASLRAHRRHQISMFSLSCYCKLRFSASPARLRILGQQEAERSRKSFWRKPPRQMKIVFRGTAQPVGEVWLDDLLLTSLSPEDEEPIGPKPLTTQSLANGFWKYLFRLVRPKGFTLSREQAGRARQIVQQANTSDH